jgi:twinfilin-like protein
MTYGTPLSVQMLYASTRAALTKALGASSFPSTLFATSKSDLLPGAYAAFLTAQSAPPPLSEREKDMQAARDAERLAVEAAGGYEGARARVSPLQHSKGFELAREVEEALEALGNESGGVGEGGRLVVMHIENEKIVLNGSVSGPCTAAELGRKLPASSPSYAFFARPLPDVRHTGMHVLFSTAVEPSLTIK